MCSRGELHFLSSDVSLFTSCLFSNSILPFCASTGFVATLANGEDPAKLPANVAPSSSDGGGKVLLDTTCGGSAGRLLSSITAPPGGFEFALAVLGILLLFLRLAIRLS